MLKRDNCAFAIIDQKCYKNSDDVASNKQKNEASYQGHMSNSNTSDTVRIIITIA